MKKEKTRRCYSVNEVMEMYGVGRNTVYNLINSGELKTLKLPRRRLILADSLRSMEKHFTN